MAYERYPRNPASRADYYGRDELSDYGSDRDSGYLGQRDDAPQGYGARRTGGLNSDREVYDRDYGARDYYGGRQLADSRMGSPYENSYTGVGGGYRDTNRDFGRMRDRSYDYDRAVARRDTRRNYNREPEGYDYRERGFLDRAGDEIMSWFGDEDAERRRRLDQRYSEQMGDMSDAHYRNWRNDRMAEYDRDYDEYRRENAQRFHNEFMTWRTERQGQRDSLARVKEHMEVVGSDGGHVGTVDFVRGDRIILTRNDADAGGHHHSIPSRWIEMVDDKVTIRKTADEAQSHWRDEERNKALFKEERSDFRSDHNLNRSFSGTY